MWTPRIRHPRLVTTLGAIAAFHLVLSSPLRAEDATAGVPANVELTQPEPAPQQPQDRKDGSGAAIALAAAGAAIAGASCAMLMKQAQEAATESERNMLRMMAMQQCSQAAQNLANAAQNEKGKDGLTSPQSPAGPQLKSDPQQQAQAKAEPTQSALPESSSEAIADVTPEMDAPTETASGVVAPEVFNGGGTVIPEEKVKVAGGPSSSTPKVIPKNGVEFNDDAKAGEGSTTAFGQPNFLGQSGAPNVPAGNKDLKQLLSGDPREITGRKNGKEGGGDTHGDGSAGGGEKESKSNEGDMSAMLAQLMGGGPAGGGDAGGPSNQVMNLKEFAKANGGTGEGEDLPNVFQYAAYRYRQLDQERAVRRPGDPNKATALDSVPEARVKTAAKSPRAKTTSARVLASKPVAMRTASRRGGKR